MAIDLLLDLMDQGADICHDVLIGFRDIFGPELLLRAFESNRHVFDLGQLRLNQATDLMGQVV